MLEMLMGKEDKNSSCRVTYRYFGDRKSEFETQIIPKRNRLLDDIESFIESLYVKKKGGRVKVEE